MIRSIATKITETSPSAMVGVRRLPLSKREDVQAMASAGHRMSAIREKVEAGERLSFEDGVALSVLGAARN